jgi:hypothetical protein
VRNRTFRLRRSRRPSDVGDVHTSRGFRRHDPKTAWGPAVAVFTVVFAVDQAIGPVLSGWLADATHSLYAGLAGSVTILLAASAAAMYQRGSNAELTSSRQRPSISWP